MSEIIKEDGDGQIIIAVIKEFGQYSLYIGNTVINCRNKKDAIRRFNLMMKVVEF